MVNINKIKVIIFNFNIPTLFNGVDWVDYEVALSKNKSAVLVLDSPSLHLKLENYYDDTYAIHDLNMIDFLSKKYDALNDILDYVGYNQSINELIDLMNDDDISLDRKYYLRSLLYYKTAQEGKEIKTYGLMVKNFDDLVNEFPEDFIHCEVESYNGDYSKSKITIETCLTREELNEKFKDYLL